MVRHDNPERGAEAITLVRSKGDTPIRVLFLCTHNSARSQIAEALLSRKRQGRFEVASAGTEPGEAVHPLALDALARAGIDWSGARPKGLEAVLDGTVWDLVITVCDRAREACPRLPGRPVTVHWGMPDPAAEEGGEETRKAAFWDVLTFLGRRVDLLCALPDHKLRGMSLRLAMQQIESSHEPYGGQGRTE